MADLRKLKRRRNTLGAPPSIEDASPNLNAPEVAPFLGSPAQAPHYAVISHAAPDRSPTQPSTIDQTRLDARTLRKTGRTLQLATRVSWEFDTKLRHIAQRDGLKLVEVLERALESYEHTRGS